MEEQKKIKINDVELLAVEVPQNLIDLGCEIALMNLPFGNEEIYFYLNNEPVHTISLSVKSCDYEIIGLVGEEYLYIVKLAGICLEYAEPGDFDDIAKDVAKFKEARGLKDNMLLLKKL